MHSLALALNQQATTLFFGVCDGLSSVGLAAKKRHRGLPAVPVTPPPGVPPPPVLVSLVATVSWYRPGPMGAVLSKGQTAAE